MGVTVKVKKKGKGFAKLRERLRKLKGEKAQAGYFSTSGVHPSSGFSYPQLMYLHEFGFKSGNKQIPARPLMGITASMFERSLDSLTRKHLTKYLMGNTTAANFLDIYSKQIHDLAMAVFGNTSLLKNNTPFTQSLKNGRDEPLVNNGDLKDNFQYGNTIDGVTA